MSDAKTPEQTTPYIECTCELGYKRCRCTPEQTTDRETIERIMSPSKYDTHRIVRDLVAALAVAREEGRQEATREATRYVPPRDRLDDAIDALVCEAMEEGARLEREHHG